MATEIWEVAASVVKIVGFGALVLTGLGILGSL